MRSPVVVLCGATMDERVPVRCSGNTNTKYDGKVWMERLLEIVELNETFLSSTEPLSLSSLNSGDHVKVCQALKNGRKHVFNSYDEFEARSMPTKRQLEDLETTTAPDASKAKRKPVSRAHYIFSHQQFEIFTAYAYGLCIRSLSTMSTTRVAGFVTWKS